MSQPSAPRRVALYSHDTQGLGHIRRNIALAATLVADGDTDVLLITGTPAAGTLPLPPRTDLVVLPAAAKSGDGSYHSRSLSLPVDQLLRIRGELIKATIASFAPDLLIVDKVPLGLKGELVPTLAALKDTSTRAVLGLREVLDEPAATMREWRRDGSSAAIARYYDAVWVYGDPGVFDPATAYHWPRSVTDKITYTGYLAHGRYRGPESVRPPASGSPGPEHTDPEHTGTEHTGTEHPGSGLPAPGYLLAQVGGGQDGFALASAFARAIRATARRGVLLTGPLMAAGDRRRIERLAGDLPQLTVLDFHPDPTALVAGAAGVVSMAGYNSVCELLSAGVPTLLVPRVRPRAEQLVRAESLAALGLVDLLHPHDLTPADLVTWAAGLSAERTARGPAEVIDLDGLARIPALVRHLTEGIHRAA